MTVSSAQNKVSYAGDGSTTVFSVPFLFQANGDITAILRDANGAETTWVEGTDYTLTGAGNPSGGTLTATTVPGSGEKLTIKRVVSLTQETDYPEGGQFPAQSHEDALDRGTMADQQLQEQIDRGVKLKATSALSDIELPEPGADELIKWNSAGTGLETKKVADISAITLPVAVADGGTGGTDAPTARTNLGVPPTTRAINSGDGLSGGGDLSADRALALDIAALTALTAPATGDEVPVEDVSVPGRRKITLADLLKVVNALTEDTAPDTAADFLLEYDASVGVAKKVLMSKVGGGGSILVATPGVTEDATEVSTTSTIPDDDTIPQSGEGAAYTQLDTTYTPAATANILIIDVLVWGAWSSTNGHIFAALFKDADAGALRASMARIHSTFDLQGLHVRHKMVAGTTAAIAFKVRFGPGNPGAGTMFINRDGDGNILGGALQSSMIIKEYTP